MNRHILTGMQILGQQTWLKDQAIVIEDGKIKAIIPKDMTNHHLPAQKSDFHAEDYLIPGLIDLHIHGANHHDVMDANVDGLKIISRSLATEGVTGFLATTMTASVDKIEAALATIPLAMRDEEGAAILGVHLEGPFITKEKMGAQAGEFIQNPNLDLIDHWQKRAQGMLKIITLAPELSGAIDFIRGLQVRNIIAALGHTNATFAEANIAIQNDCHYATHLFNAMRSIHQREPGVVAAVLLAEQVFAELIVDGVHLHPAMIELALLCKGKNKLLLVSDAMRAKCLRDGQYELGGQQVSVSNNRAELADGRLAGSILRLPQAIKNLIAYTSCSLIDAIRMASLIPARVLNLERYKGSIDLGKDADLVVLDHELTVKMTMRAGKIIYHS